jgi:hypothetical protein
MTWDEANTFAYEMWSMWVSDKPHSTNPYQRYNLERIHAGMLQELRYTKTIPECKSVTTEIRGQLIKLGKARKALNE